MAAVQTAPAPIESKRETHPPHVAFSETAEHWLAAERHQLVLFGPVLLGAGIAAWFVLPGARAWEAAMLAGLAIVIVGLIADGLLRRVLMLGGLLLAAGVLLAWYRAEAVRTPRIDHRVTLDLAGEVVGIDAQPAKGRTRLLVRTPTGLVARVGIRGEPPANVARGATIALRAALSPPPGPNVPGGYHFARRAWFEGTGAVGYALSDVRVVRPPPDETGASQKLQAYRARLTARLQQAVGGGSGGLAAALVTGDRGGITEDTTNAMRDSGLAHLISISGLHIAAIVGGVLWATRRMLALSPWLTLRLDIKAVAAGLAALAGIVYTLIAGAEVPTIRACIAVLVALVGLVVGREAITLRLVAVAAFVILVLRPEYLVGPSFQLSFAAVTAIVALYQSPLGSWMSTRGDSGGWQHGVFRSLAALLASGLAAEVALAPIAIFHFNQTGLYGMLANLVAIPLTSFVIMPLLFAALLLDAVGLAAPVFWLLGHAIGLLVALAGWTAALPGAVAHLPSSPNWAFGLAMLGGIWFCLWQTRRRWFGLVPALAGVTGMALASPPDLIVDGEGRHVAIVAGGRVALLRPRAGDYVRSMWADAAGSADTTDFDALAAADCGIDSCVATVGEGGRRLRLLATRSPVLIDRARMEPACRTADIVVSDRRLPPWCAPRWLKLDRPALARTGALSISIEDGRVRSVAGDDGAHQWAARAASGPQ